MYLLNEIMLKPVGRVLKERAAKIQADVNEGASARFQAEELLKHYEQHLQQIRAEAQKVINDAVDIAGKERNTKVADVRADGQKKILEAKSALTSERDLIMDALVREEMEIVQSVVEKLLGEKKLVTLNADHVRRALEEAC